MTAGVLRRRWIAAGLLAASVTGTAALPPATAASPATEASLVGGGTATSEGAMAAVAALPDTDLLSLEAFGGDVSTRPGCTYTSNLGVQDAPGRRPSGSLAAVERLREAIRAEGGPDGTPDQRAHDGADCLDFARTTVRPPVDETAPVTALHFAVDGISYVTLENASVSATLTTAQLRDVYTADGVPGTAECAGLMPLLPNAAGGTRATFLQDIAVGGIRQPRLGTCVSSTAVNRLTGAEEPIVPDSPVFLTDMRQVLPYNVATYASQQGRQVPGDYVAGLRLGAVAGSRPLTESPSHPLDGISYATLETSTISATLGPAALRDLYRRNGDPEAASGPCGARPLLPHAGSALRADFLSRIGLGEDGVGTCVRDVAVTELGTVGPIVANDLAFLTDSRQVLPVRVSDWAAQQGRTVLGSYVTGRRLGAVAGDVPLVSDPGYIHARQLYTVVSTARVGDPAIAAHFVGTSSLVCSHSHVLHQYGLGTDGRCGAPATDVDHD